jgi:hypothetical protein
MNTQINIPDVGSPDPELNTSPVADEMDEDYEVLKQEVPGEPVCYFNDQSYENNSYVRSSTSLLKCNYGIWLQQGGSDPDNP